MFIAGSYMLYSPSNAGGGSGQHATALGQSMPPTYATALTSSGSGLAAPGHVGTMSAAGAFPISAFASPASVPALTAALHHHRLQQLHHLQQQHLHHHHHHHHSAGLMMTSAAAAHSATGTSLPLPSAETATDLVLKKMSGFSVSDILERESDPMGKDGGSQPLLPVAVPKTAACVVITSSRTSANAGHCSGGGMSVDDNLRPLSGYTSSPPPLPTHPSPGNSSVSSSPPPPAYFSPGSLSSSVNRCPVARESRELKFGMERILSNELAPPKDLSPPAPPYTCCVSPLTSAASRNCRLTGATCDCPHPFCDGSAVYPLYAYPAAAAAAAALTHAIAYPSCTFYNGAASLTGGGGGGGGDLDPRLHQAHHGVGLHHPNGQVPSSGKRKRSWSRAVFSNLQRKGLEKRFQMQKYITKPDRRQLAATLGLTDAQVKVWFQNRRMKWRHSKEAKEEFAKQKNKTVVGGASGNGVSAPDDGKECTSAVSVNSDTASVKSESPSVVAAGGSKTVDFNVKCIESSNVVALPPKPLTSTTGS